MLAGALPVGGHSQFVNFVKFYLRELLFAWGALRASEVLPADLQMPESPAHVRRAEPAHVELLLSKVVDSPA